MASGAMKGRCADPWDAGYDSGIDDEWRAVVREFVSVMSTQNPRVDKVKFASACS
jgi:hypothetical protein